MKYRNYSFLIVVYDLDDLELFKLSVASLLNQTLKPHQVVLVVNGPVNEKLNEFILMTSRAHPSFDVLKLSRNYGLATALNRGLEICSSEIILRADADDICLPHRAQVQLDFFNKNLAVDVISSQIIEFDCVERSPVSIRRLKLCHEDIIKQSRLVCPMNHMSVAFKRSSILEVNGYPLFEKAQDWALWSKMLKLGYRFENIEDILVLASINLNGKKRSLSHFLFELRVIWLQLKIRHINIVQFGFSVIIRLTWRLILMKYLGNKMNFINRDTLKQREAIIWQQHSYLFQISNKT